MKKIDLVIIGGGPAGMAAAIEADKNGIKDILIIERDRELGGILYQCIHNGFGLHLYKKMYTGPEYAELYIEEINKREIDYLSDTMVIDLKPDNTVVAVNRENGLMNIKAKAVVLAMGCRERTRGAISIAGTRPSGVITAGTAQRYINMEGYMVGKNVVILGSGDVGLIMARRLTFEGAKVKGVLEIMPSSAGLLRNISQCLDDYNIPLLLNHTVVEVLGKDRVEGLIAAKVDKWRNPIKGTERHYNCDTLLLSVGLIPENELSKKAGISQNKKTNGLIVNDYMETSNEGVFACGNVVHVHDVVDYVSEEGKLAGKSAAYYLHKKEQNFNLNFVKRKIQIEVKDNIKQVGNIGRRRRNVNTKEKNIICIQCPKGCPLKVFEKNGEIIVENNGCKNGVEYGKAEFIEPKRILTSTVIVKGSHLERLPVRTEKTVPKKKIKEIMDIINRKVVTAPIEIGEILVKNIGDTGVNLIASRSMKKIEI